MKTIAILSQKGGSGKTTLALHMAVAAKEDNKTAVIIDLDPQASAHTWYSVRKRLGKKIEPHVLATHPAQLEEIIMNCQNQGVDLVFIDTAPQSDTIAVKAAQIADLVLITCKPSIMDLRAIQNTLRLTEIADVEPHVVLTQIESVGVRHKEASDILKRLNVSILPVGTGKRVAYMDSLIEGQTVTEFDPSGKAAEETRYLFNYINKLVLDTANRERAA